MDFTLERSFLLEKVNHLTAKNTHLLSTINRAKVHILFRLPPYHPSLNPIELVWRDIKGELANNFSGLILDRKKDYWAKIFETFAIIEWKKCCEHTKKCKNSTGLRTILQRKK